MTTNTMTGKAFLARAKDWLDWVHAFQEPNTRMIAIAESKPRGLHHDGNLILDSEGHVWTRAYSPPHDFIELSRSEAYGEYQPTGRRIRMETFVAFNGGADPLTVGGVTFVARGWQRPEEDWCWVRRPQSTSDTLEHLQASRKHYKAGVEFGTVLLTLSPTAIDTWAKARAIQAHHDGVSRDNTDADWTSFIESFQLSPARELPDPSGLQCALHLLVDRAAGLRHTSYAH